MPERSSDRPVTACEFSPHNRWRDAIIANDSDLLAKLAEDEFGCRIDDPAHLLKRCKGGDPGDKKSEAYWRMWVKQRVGDMKRDDPDDSVDFGITIRTVMHVGFLWIEENDHHIFYLRTYIDEKGGVRRWYADDREVEEDLVEPARSRLFRTQHFIVPIDHTAKVVSGWNPMVQGSSDAQT